MLQHYLEQFIISAVCLQAVFPLILDLLRKCRKRCKNAVANHKQQCHLLKVLCDFKQNKKKVITLEDCQEVSFLDHDWHTLKQMKQKRFSGNVVHLFLRLLVLLHQVSKKQRRMKKKWHCTRC